MSTKSISNRLNSGKSTGPENTNSTRFNATKHGLLAAGVTELDDAEGYRATLHELVKEKDPAWSSGDIPGQVRRPRHDKVATRRAPGS